MNQSPRRLDVPPLVLVWPIESRSVSLPSRRVWVRASAGGVQAIEDPLVHRVAAAMAETDQPERHGGRQLEGGSLCTQAANSRAKATCRRTRSCNPSTPNERITNHSFRARNRRPSGTCQSR